MGDVLSIEFSRKAFRRRDLAAEGAEILFFTGVRYERYE